MTSQCSARTPSWTRMISTTIQFTGWPIPKNRPWTITKSPSASITPGSYLSGGGMLMLKGALATRRDVGAMLNVVGGPEPLSRDVVPPVEQGVEGLADN